MDDVVVGALIGAASSLLGVWALHRFNLTRDREAAKQRRWDQLWQRRLDIILEIERRAGLLIDRLSNYRPLDQYDPHPTDLYSYLENEKGSVYRYDSVWRSLNEFNHRASVVISDWNKWEDRQERQQAVADLEIAFGQLTEAIDGLKEDDDQANVG